jgi:hypothetical protein
MRHLVERMMPLNLLVSLMDMIAQQRLVTAPVRGEDFMFEDALDAQLAAIDVRAADTA